MKTIFILNDTGYDGDNILGVSDDIEVLEKLRARFGGNIQEFPILDRKRIGEKIFFEVYFGHNHKPESCEMVNTYLEIEPEVIYKDRAFLNIKKGCHYVECWASCGEEAKVRAAKIREEFLQIEAYKASKEGK